MTYTTNKSITTTRITTSKSSYTMQDENKETKRDLERKGKKIGIIGKTKFPPRSEQAQFLTLASLVKKEAS